MDHTLLRDRRLESQPRRGEPGQATCFCRLSKHQDNICIYGVNQKNTSSAPKASDLDQDITLSYLCAYYLRDISRTKKNSLLALRRQVVVLHSYIVCNVARSYSWERRRPASKSRRSN